MGSTWIWGGVLGFRLIHFLKSQLLPNQLWIAHSCLLLTICSEPEAKAATYRTSLAPQKERPMVGLFGCFGYTVQLYNIIYTSLHTYGYGSIPINTIFSRMNIHLPAILMWTTGVQGFDTLPYYGRFSLFFPYFVGVCGSPNNDNHPAWGLRWDWGNRSVSCHWRLIWL